MNSLKKGNSLKKATVWKGESPKKMNSLKKGNSLKKATVWKGKQSEKGEQSE